MKERPVLMSAPMVQAILNGAKTQTRRIMKPQPRMFAGAPRWRWKGFAWQSGDCPIYFGPYAVGDRLWVRESLKRENDFADFGSGPVNEPYYVYASDGCAVDDHTPADEPHQKSVPSIHMPRWASRITLEITKLRIQRVQDISEEDAEAEGAMFWWNLLSRSEQERIYSGGRGPRGAFRDLWDSINAKCERGRKLHDKEHWKPPYAWDMNPWVWAISFVRAK